MDKTPPCNSIIETKLREKKNGQKDNVRQCLRQIPEAFYFFPSANFYGATILDISKSNCCKT